MPKLSDNGESTVREALARFDSLPDVARVRLPVVCSLFAISAPTVWRRVKAGALPRPMKDGAATVWQVGQLRAKLHGGAR